MAFMRNISGTKQVIFIIIVFVVSRIIIMLLGIDLNIWALTAYWQYLDIETLRHHLLTGVWYDHAQPPVFNLFLGLILKIGGSYAPLLFTLIFKLITLVNTLLLFSITRKLVTVDFIPLLVALAYLMSPATLIFECELFYTTSISLLLLVSVFYLIHLNQSSKLLHTLGFMLPLALLCLTRSVYHFFWLVLIAAVFLLYFRKKELFKNLLTASLISLILTGSWYVKNKILFGKFSTSTWLGMNMARNVFHDNEVHDSSRIEAYEPFSKISVYRKFLDPNYEERFKGWNDKDLLQEMKNDSFINETEVSYIPVSDLYQKASIAYIKSHPGAYVKNIFQSCILYFTPGTLYSLALEQVAKIKTYDLLYSFNLTAFAHGKQSRRILLTISALPKMILYFFVFAFIFRYCKRTKYISAWNLFIMLTILYVFGISSFFEHYENMRFRFETEPLFLILAAQVFSMLFSRHKIRRQPSLKELIA
jgi:hypothetical protein